MKRVLIASLAVAAFAAVAGASVERGESIVRNIAVCGSCHAADPKDPDGPLSGGLEFDDWRIGRVHAANLTPDVETGLGSWSEGEIAHAIRTGQRKDGRLLAPVMPYEWFHDMSDDDALSVAQYLKTLPPVHNAIAQHPNLMFKMGKLLFLHAKTGAPAPAPARAATAEYGGYLAQHVGLCAECHTPRGGLMGRPDKSRLFAGDAHPPKTFPQNPANITPDVATGIGGWSEDEFVRTIRTGVDPKGITLNPFMPWHEVRRMADDDLHALYRYLRTVAPVRNNIVRK